MSELRRLARWIRRSDGNAVCLTGAGVSTASGLPDFRSPSGLWARYDPMVVGHVDTLRRDPALVWRYYVDRLSASDPQPNPAHHAIAALERAGHLAQLVTQNVDGLHEAAGSNPLCLHGTLTEASCRECGQRLPMSEALALRAERPDGVPPCPGCGAALGPAIVLFGEPLPPIIEEAGVRAYDAELILCCGTSLQVTPACYLPRYTASSGGRVAILNATETAFDPREVDLGTDRYIELRGALEQLLPALCAELGLSADHAS